MSRRPPGPPLIDRICTTHRSTYSPQGDDPSDVCLARLTDRHDTLGECVAVDKVMLLADTNFTIKCLECEIGDLGGPRIEHIRYVWLFTGMTESEFEAWEDSI